MIEAADIAATIAKKPRLIEQALNQVAEMFEICDFDPNRDSIDARANADDV